MSYWIDGVGFSLLVALGVIGMAPVLVEFVAEKWRALKKAWRGFGG